MGGCNNIILWAGFAALDHKWLDLDILLVKVIRKGGEKK